MALTDFLEDVALLVLAAEADGLGDEQGVYRQGRLFRAGFSRERSSAAFMADRRGVKSLWRITTLAEDPPLAPGDVLLRLRDNLRYRVVSQSAQSPESAPLQCRFVEAEVML